MGRLVTILVGALIVGLAVWAALPSRTSAVAAAATADDAPGSGSAGSAGSAANGSVEAPVARCLQAEREVAARRRERNAPAPAGQPSDAAVVSLACAPLYREAACRAAMMRFDEPPPEARSATVFRACARAYCPLLPAPRPAACANPDVVPEDQWVAWSELRKAILTHDLGADVAQRVLAPPR